jgi:hypothetical protein
MEETLRNIGTNRRVILKLASHKIGYECEDWKYTVRNRNQSRTPVTNTAKFWVPKTGWKFV